MQASDYETITGRRLGLNRVNAAERDFLGRVRDEYRGQPEWTEFGSWWVTEFESSGLATESVVYRVCQDLEARLGIAQGKVAPPDYRDYLVDLIEERYGSRSRFCKEIGIDPGHLSRVLANRAEFSFPLLQKIMVALQAALVIQSREKLLEHLSPKDASRALAAAVV